jgi:dienelactone hydrolase
MTFRDTPHAASAEQETIMSESVQEPSWVARFRSPHLLTVRPVVSDPDWALVVDNGISGATGSIRYLGAGPAADGARDVDVPFPVGYESIVTADRRWVVQLEDDGGSEVGHLHAFPVAGGPSVDLTPGMDPYVVRGMELGVDGSTLLVTLVDEQGYHLVRIPANPWGTPEVIASTPNEAWYGQVSADGRLASLDVTDQNPDVRRAAVAVYSLADRTKVAVCDDLPDGPVRAVRFSPEPGDPRLLVATERTGFARPAIWNPLTGERRDFPLDEYRGDVQPLDWHAASNRILALHVQDGLHRLLVVDTGTGVARVVREGGGSFADPDVAGSLHYYASSYLGSDGAAMVFEQSWETPPHVIRLDAADVARTVVSPAIVPTGRSLTSTMVNSADGTPVQLWWGLPEGEVRGTVLEVHGGPNLVTVDAYSPSAQAWLAQGYAYAALNYRGSVTFGRAFREGFWGSAGDREIEDITAALDWLAAKGLAVPATTFITGASYGGHLTLLSLGRLPDRFAGGFAHVAMADWASAFEDMNPAVRLVWINFLRNSDRPLEDAIAYFSPIGYVEAVRGSAWLSQGSRDTRTPPAQAQRYVDALKGAGGDVLIEWYDAGHEPVGLAGPEQAQHRMLELAEMTIAGRRWSAD